MEDDVKRSLEKLFVGIVALSAMICIGCSQVIPIASGYSVIGQVNGRLVDDLGSPIAGATITYDSPNASLVSKAISAVTSDSTGRFEVSNLQTGTYTFTAAATTANMVTTFTSRIPSIEELDANSTTGDSAEIKANRSYVKTLDANVIMPRRGGTISGSFATDPTSSDTYRLVMDFNTMSKTSATDTDRIDTYLVSDATRTIATTAETDGSFSFSNLPMTTYGGTSASNAKGMCTSIDVYSVKTGDYLTSLTLPVALYTLGQDGSEPTYTINRLATSYSPMALVNPAAGSTVKLTSVTDPFVLTFNNPISSTKSYLDGEGRYTFAYYAASSASTVKLAATVVASGKTLSITPTEPLSYNGSYVLSYYVYDGVTSYASGIITYTTGASLVAPVAVNDLAINTDTTTYYGKSPATFNYNDTVFPVTFTYNQDYTYTPTYTVTTAAGIVKSGTAAIGYSPLAKGTGNIAYATITLASGIWNSGDSLLLKLVESYSAPLTNNTLTTDSNTLPVVTDKMAPTAVRTIGLDHGYVTNGEGSTSGGWTPSTATSISAGSTALDIYPNATRALTTTDFANKGYYNFTIETDGTEYIDIAKLKLSGLNGMSYSVAYPTTMTAKTVTTATITLILSPRTSASDGTYAYLGKTFSLDIFDLAGNQYSGGTITATLKEGTHITSIYNSTYGYYNYYTSTNANLPY